MSVTVGFRKGRSTEEAIVEISDNLKKAIDKNLYNNIVESF